jgi:hypothetical protein
MTIAMQPIYTQTVGSGGATSITFNNIPQTFTDLKLVSSARITPNESQTRSIGVYLNGDTFPANASMRYLLGSGSAVNSVSNSGFADAGYVNDASTTASTFSSHEMYIPEYRGSQFKQMIVDAVTENNATFARSKLLAVLYRTTSPITSLKIEATGFAQYSTFTIYGITRG